MLKYCVKKLCLTLCVRMIDCCKNYLTTTGLYYCICTVVEADTQTVD